MIYIKKVISQDLERTPTFSQESWESFFKLPLENDEDVEINFKDSSDNQIHECLVKRRATRNEIRAFIGPLLSKYSAKIGDVLVFKTTRNPNIYNFEFLDLNKPELTILDTLFNGKNHQVIAT